MLIFSKIIACISLNENILNVLRRNSCTDQKHLEIRDITTGEGGGCDTPPIFGILDTFSHFAFVQNLNYFLL